MDIGISNWIYGEEDLEKTFIRLNKFGYNVIEIGILDPKKIDVPRIKRYMDKYQIKCCSICTLAPFSEDLSIRKNLIDSNITVRKNTIQFHRECIDIGAELGANVVLTVPSGVGNIDQTFTQENINLCADNLKEIGDYAASKDSISFVIEPLNRYENGFIHRVDEALTILKEINHPNVKTMIDCFHANIEEDDTAEAIRMGGSKIVNIHLADSNRKSLGRGQTDWLKIFEAIKEIDYSGPLVCEPLPPMGNVYDSQKGIRPEADLYAQECIEYIESIMNKVGII